MEPHAVFTPPHATSPYETDRFDFKEMLPPDDGGRLRLRKTCCAFANSQGGFIVFGINAQVGLAVDQRIPGVDPKVDFPVQFGDYPARCIPTVDWAPKNPPLALPSGRLLHIIHIPPSPSAPHAVRDESDGWYFAKRTAKGNEPMTIEEIRAAFLGFYEKRVKLQLLRAELETLKAQAESMENMGFHMDKEAVVSPLELTVIESVLSDTYTLLSRSQSLLQKLGKIRSLCREVNASVSLLQPIYHGGNVALGQQRWGKAVSDHNLLVTSASLQIKTLVDDAVPLLDELTK